LRKKLAVALLALDCDVDAVTQTALFKSPKFRALFQESDQAMSEYFYCQQIHSGTPMNRGYCFSSDFCSALSIPSDKQINGLYR
jgi:hypothetical protein